MLLKEDRIEIPGFDAIWNAIKNDVLRYMQRINARNVNGFAKRNFTLMVNNLPKNSFFNSLYLKLDTYLLPKGTDASKIPDNFNASEFDPNVSLSPNRKLNRVTITSKVVSTPERFFNDLLPEIYHEMTHAYEYFQKLLQGYKPVNMQDDTAYNLRDLHSIMGNKNVTPLEKNLAVLFYYCDQSEYNSRLSEFYGEVMYTKITKNNFQQILVSTKVWRKVAFLKNVITYMNQVTDPNDQEKLLTIGNVMNGRIQSKTYFDYPTLLKDVTSKYSALKNNTYKDFSKILVDLYNKQQKR